MKRGSVLLIIGIVISILLIAGVSAGVYFYKYHVFEDVEICLTNEKQVLPIQCTSKQDCLSQLEKNEEFSQAQTRLEEMPDFMSEEFEKAIDRAVLCNQTCEIRKIRGMGSGEIGQVNCQEDDEIISIALTGERLLILLRYAEENNLTNYQ